MDDRRNTDLNVDQARAINVKDTELERDASTGEADVVAKAATENVENS